MSYKNWNIQELLNESININSEISARIKTVLDMENAFLTYNPNGTDEDYRVLIETGLDLVRKGQQAAEGESDE
jgi:hypothetical protein